MCFFFHFLGAPLPHPIFKRFLDSFGNFNFLEYFQMFVGYHHRIAHLL